MQYDLHAPKCLSSSLKDVFKRLVLERFQTYLKIDFFYAASWKIPFCSFTHLFLYVRFSFSFRLQKKKKREEKKK